MLDVIAAALVRDRADPQALAVGLAPHPAPRADFDSASVDLSPDWVVLDPRNPLLKPWLNRSVAAHLGALPDSEPDGREMSTAKRLGDWLAASGAGERP